MIKITFCKCYLVILNDFSWMKIIVHRYNNSVYVFLKVLWQCVNIYMIAISIIVALFAFELKSKTWTQDAPDILDAIWVILEYHGHGNKSYLNNIGELTIKYMLESQEICISEKTKKKKRKKKRWNCYLAKIQTSTKCFLTCSYGCFYSQ